MAPVGPSLPPSFAGPQLPQTAGPQLPPSIGPSAPPADSDSDDDYSPSLPPDLVAARIAGPSLSKPILGPSLPPSLPGPPPPKRETPLSAPYLDDDDDSFGPMPLAEGYRVVENEGVRLVREREEREEEKRRKAAEGKGKMVREEWMLVPPKEVSLLSTMDSTKLKSRTFQQSAKVAEKKDASGPNLWTETPAERQQRLEDEMLGKKRKAEGLTGGADEDESDEARRKRQRDWQLREEVDRHNKAARATTLLDSHSKGKKGEAKDDKKGPPGIWDRDRDMSIGGRLMDEGKRADIVKSARELGGRFGGGSYL